MSKNINIRLGFNHYINIDDKRAMYESALLIKGHSFNEYELKWYIFIHKNKLRFDELVNLVEEYYRLNTSEFNGIKFQLLIILHTEYGEYEELFRLILDLINSKQKEFVFNLYVLAIRNLNNLFRLNLSIKIQNNIYPHIVDLYPERVSEIQIHLNDTKNALLNFRQAKKVFKLNNNFDIIFQDEIIEVQDNINDFQINPQKFFLSNNKKLSFIKIDNAKILTYDYKYCITFNNKIIDNINGISSFILSRFSEYLECNVEKINYYHILFYPPAISDFGYFNFITNILLPLIEINNSHLKDIPIILNENLISKIQPLLPSLNLIPQDEYSLSYINSLYTFYINGRSLSKGHIDILNNHFYFEDSGIKKEKLIYISRSGSENRKLLNEEQLIKHLEKNGFTTILLEKLSIKEQIIVFQNAELIVAPHGAGLINLVFSKNLKACIEIFPENYHIDGFMNISKQMNIAHLNFYGSPLTNNSWTLNIEKFNEFLNVHLKNICI